MAFIYPVEVPEGALTTEQIHLLLSNPNVVANRVADLVHQRFVADYLLPNKYDANGGMAAYSEDASAFPEDDPRQVAAGAEYPNVSMDSGELHMVATAKWGSGAIVTDELISQMGIAELNKHLRRLANGVIRKVDDVAMSVILSKVQASVAAPRGWTTAGAMVESLLKAKQSREDLGTGINPDTVLVPPAQYAKIQGMLIDEKALPREAGNPVVNGNLPVSALGFTWVTSSRYKGTDPLLIDRELFGGIADHNLKSPEFGSADKGGVQVSVTRQAERDAYRIRARRVCVPVVTDAAAAVKITGHNLNG